MIADLAKPAVSLLNCAWSTVSLSELQVFALPTRLVEFGNVAAECRPQVGVARGGDAAIAPAAPDRAASLLAVVLVVVLLARRRNCPLPSPSLAAYPDALAGGTLATPARTRPRSSGGVLVLLVVAVLVCVVAQ
eukprot:COSAG02_NODE_1333_length_13206_cov_221.257801_16_plen_134_part_00